MTSLVFSPDGESLFCCDSIGRQPHRRPDRAVPAGLDERQLRPAKVSWRGGGATSEVSIPWRAGFSGNVVDRPAAETYRVLEIMDTTRFPLRLAAVFFLGAVSVIRVPTGTGGAADGQPQAHPTSPPKEAGEPIRQVLREAARAVPVGTEPQARAFMQPRRDHQGPGPGRRQGGRALGIGAAGVRGHAGDGRGPPGLGPRRDRLGPVRRRRP